MTIAQSLFKEQMLEFIESEDEPFNLEFLVKNCNDKFIEEGYYQDALCALEEEGQIVRFDHHYLSTRVLMKRWIKTEERRAHENRLSLPQSIVCQILELLDQRPELGYTNVGEFIRDAIRRFIECHRGVV